ncbi:DNA helicase [Saccharomyces cerevisiae S288C]|uniref:ATP-dependent DNA helicase MER3 n=1 Tax=Saccharomyces cerevisiae (strain ATCC 204508 / S288c) TaxID=559292 RepID=HFM1_YEAST|nr:DNA helicase [Saccharomyces cerevisiae S288C]P51979.3 RecName: Full=ATP-dependent DNA helicase MER3; AltName: Full=Protein HFM1 [Saccharomyces cerevisiae S288C]AJS03040.1 Hfm1p [Saccharomyces cerevisiae YJM1450]KAF6740620.1 DNA helicase [Saccharomyces cerevisiae]KAG2515960.1 DNA helicase [Saccharomyces cerevisiae]CAI4466066.1 CBK_G0018030.mRNA.1.CDS.1 [Saccharomyces cerevisiae]CAI7112438.1 BBF_collapsed_G0018270.mRNA.1.CDS.1 [Saccharomyces cerevisiae]|eukprot:NP_011263.2 Hfm1p [Saccharomyces cerevisiae S288C]
MKTKFDRLGTGKRSRPSPNNIDFNDQSATFKRNKKNSRQPSFKVGLSYNSLLDDCDDENETEEIFEGRGLQFFDKDDNFSITADDTQVTSKLFDHDLEQTPDEEAKKPKKVTIRKSAKKCLSTTILPDSFRGVFKFTEFNKMQSEAFPSIYESNENCIISSPTGSGKTVLFELAILRLIKETNSDTNNTKIIYIAPTKSLCYEMYKNWFPSFVNLSVGMLTSDTSFLETEKAKKCNIIITTPEKWDLLTRRWSDYSRLFELVKLVLVDEIHTIKEKRGASLEVILTRMNTMCQNIRFVALSATVPNIEDLALWLKTNNELPANILSFDESYRQVQLTKFVYGYSFNCKNDFQKDAIYNSKLIEIIEKHADNRPVLIFCPTRASTISTAKFLLNNHIFSKSKKRCNHNPSDKILNECMQQGIAFHHAGISLEDRTAVEKEFLAGSINILCSTSTLAVGVNLPAYLVIIKGTKSWNSSEIQEYSDLDVLQMIGRAGRPQFETHGCAVIMTDSKMKQTYENLIHGTDVLESSLHLNLIEHLAAETSLETVYSIETAVNWLRNTFFYVRFGKNPAAYQEVNRYVSFHSVEDSQINQFCQYLLDTLVKVKIIDISNGEYKSTAYGNAMTRHYISFESMKQFINAKKFLSLQGILNLLATSEEFSVMRVRHNEKKLFKEINLSPLLKYPFLTEKKQSQIIDRVSQKVSLLIQYELGGLEFPSYEGASKLHQTLVQDKFLVFRHCFRLLKCMVDTFIEKSDGTSLKNTLFLLRSLNGHCWENTPMVLRQLKTIGLVSVRRLIRHGITNLEEMGHLSDTQIEYYLNLKIGNGIKIKNDISLLPCLNIRTKLENCKIENEELWLTFKVEISATFKSSIWHGQHLSLDIETEKSSGELIDFRRLQVNKLQSPRGFRISAKISPKLEKIEFSIHCQEIAGLGKTIVYSTDHLASQFSAKTPNIRKDLNSLEKCLFYESSSDGEVGKTSRVSHKDGLEESLSSDDSILDYLNERKKSSKAVESAAVIHPEAHSSSHFSNGRQVRSNGNYECFHSCKDKTQCRHLCCKEGIPVKYIKEKGPSSIKPVSKPDQIRQPLLAKNINTTPHLEKRLNSKPKQWQEENTDIATVHTLPSKIYNLSQQMSSMEAGEQVLKSGPENCPEIIPIDLESSDSYSSNTAASSISDPNGDLDFLGSDIEFE